MSIKIKKSAGCLLAGLLSLSLLVGCASSGKKDTNSAPKQEMAVSTQYSPLSSGEYGDLVARNDHFVLYFKPDTCSFQVRDNNTGVAWYSNPSDEELVPVQSEEVQNTYRSQVILQYYDDREKLTTLESFKDSVQKNQIEILSLKNGVRVVYTMGQIDSNVFPEVISESTMDELKAKMDEHAISRLERFYDRIVLDELTDSLKAEYLKTYPLLEKEPLYMVRKVHANIQEELSGYFKEAGLDKNWVYSEYDKIKYEYKVVEDVIFKVTADYTLTDDGLQASLYTSAIEYNASKFKLTSATLLPYFGSADDSDKGYMVLPDGSGGLVDLDRSSDQLITISVYGEDYSSMNYTEDFYGRQVLLPVYGMQCNGSGFIAVIESGAEVSQLMCQPGGTVYPRDAIYPSFTLLQRNALSTIEAGAYSRVVYAKEKYDRTLTIGYHLLPDNKQGYAGMANVLREQLFGNRKPSVSSNMPLYLQTVGAVQRQERFLSYKIENAAATICGLDGYLPVKYDDNDSGLMTMLKDLGVKVKLNLKGRFTGKGIINGTKIASTGSKKCDTYLWLMDKYLSRCSKEMIAYMPDGAGCVSTNIIYQKDSDAGSAYGNNILDHDYLIANRSFFFDLSPVGTEVPCDDKTQIIGTDVKTLRKILQAQYNRNGGKFSKVIGFPPWWIKYTSHNSWGSLAATVVEWMFTDIVTQYNLAKEADAAHPCCTANASLYEKISLKSSFKNTNRKSSITEKFNKNTVYLLYYMGDYDSSAWLKKWVPVIWQDSGKGQAPMMWSFNPNLSDRVPMVFNYIYSNMDNMDYFVSGDSGPGYIIPGGLYNSLCPERPNPDGDKAWVDFSKPYMKRFDMDIVGFIINGNYKMNTTIMKMYNQFAPVGSFHNDPSKPLYVVNGTPYVYLKNGVGNPGSYTDSAAGMYDYIKNTMHGLNFGAFRTVCWTPSQINQLSKAFLSYAKTKDPNTTYKFVDPYTYFAMIKQSGQGVIS